MVGTRWKTFLSQVLALDTGLCRSLPQTQEDLAKEWVTKEDLDTLLGDMDV